MNYSLQIKDKNIELDIWPGECPYCHKDIEPIYLNYFPERDKLDILLKCPSVSCSRLFITRYYTYNDYFFRFDSTTFGEIKTILFSTEIETISPSFIKIYNESHFAESYELLEICGVGYRKALEFLIKDYLIRLHPDRIESIQQKLLGKCIKDDVADPKVKSVAERAVWLGNDETHYVRLWDEKSLADLKTLIHLTIHWIEAEELTNAFEKNMTSKK